MRLSAKYERFAQLLADGLTQAEAYLEAGFHPKDANNAAAGASRLVKSKPGIVKRRDEIVAERERLKAEALAIANADVVKRLALTREDVLLKMYDIYEKGVAAQPVLDNNGQPIGAYRTNLNAAKDAMKLLGSEMHGMFVERKEVRHGDLRDLSDDELIRRQAELERELKRPGTTH